MKTLLKTAALLVALPISVLANFSLRASADSTAGIILSTTCQGGYNINIWQNHTSGELLYRVTSHNGNLSLDGGTSQATEVFERTSFGMEIMNIGCGMAR